MADKLPQIPCQMPDLNTRKPSIEVLRGACDAHAHLFGPPGRYPYTPAKGYTPPPVTVEDYKRMLDVLGIEHAVIVHTGIHDGYMPNDGELLDILALWAPDAAMRKRILVDNPAALYGFQ